MIELRVFGALGLKGEPQAPLDELVVQPKTVALLVYLATARPRGWHQRDRLVGLFWPELDQDRARGSLRKTLHRLRQAVGEEVVASGGTESLSIGPGTLWSDAVAFDEAIEHGRLRDALDLYTGEVLPGFFVPETDAFERWLDEERAHYRERAVHAAWRLVERYAGNQEYTNASQLARVVARLASTDERMLRRVLTMLARLGDRAGAIAIFTTFAERLWKDYETRPSPETLKLVDAIQTNAPL